MKNTTLNGHRKGNSGRSKTARSQSIRSRQGVESKRPVTSRLGAAAKSAEDVRFAQTPADSLPGWLAKAVNWEEAALVVNGCRRLRVTVEELATIALLDAIESVRDGDTALTFLASVSDRFDKQRVA